MIDALQVINVANQKASKDYNNYPDRNGPFALHSEGKHGLDVGEEYSHPCQIWDIHVSTSAKCSGEAVSNHSNRR